MDPKDLTLADGIITGGGNSAPLADFVSAAARMETPAEPRLKDPSEFRIIGNTAVRRKDSPPKTDGTAKYAMDLHLPNQMVVVIARSPRMGGVVASFDDSDAKTVNGFIHAAALPTGAGVVVFAEHTWAALQARDAVMVEWDVSAAENRSSDQIRAELLAAVNTEAQYNVNGAQQVQTAALIDAADKVVEHSFYFPLLAHAPMEPLTCTIEATEDGGILLHDGCQFPTGPHMAMAQIFQLPMDKIRIDTMFAGGSFGRRATPTADYQVEASLAFALTDRSRPVKLVLSREDDITGGCYRPAVAHRVRVGLDGVVFA